MNCLLDEILDKGKRIHSGTLSDGKVIVRRFHSVPTVHFTTVLSREGIFFKSNYKFNKYRHPERNIIIKMTIKSENGRTQLTFRTME
jgi:hypothetical protein